MTYTRNPARKYQQVQQNAVDQNHLLVLLFEGAVKMLLNGRRHLAAGEFEAWTHCSNRVRRIMSELIIALDDEAAPELCDRLRSLYVYIQRLVTEAGLEEDMQKLQEATDLLVQLGTAWKEAKTTCQKQEGKRAV